MDFFSDNSFFDFFYSESLMDIIFWVKVFSAIASATLFVSIVILGVKTKKFWEGALNTFRSFESVIEIKGKEKAAKKWQEIALRAASNMESDRKISIIESDKLIDDIIKRAGFMGKDMADRLRQINSSQISNIDNIWQAHKIRNNLVHDPYFKLTQSDTDFVVKTYQKTLKELDIL